MNDHKLEKDSRKDYVSLEDKQAKNSISNIYVVIFTVLSLILLISSLVVIFISNKATSAASSDNKVSFDGSEGQSAPPSFRATKSPNNGNDGITIHDLSPKDTIIITHMPTPPPTPLSTSGPTVLSPTVFVDQNDLNVTLIEQSAEIVIEKCPNASSICPALHSPTICKLFETGILCEYSNPCLAFNAGFSSDQCQSHSKYDESDSDSVPSPIEAPTLNLEKERTKKPVTSPTEYPNKTPIKTSILPPSKEPTTEKNSEASNFKIQDTIPSKGPTESPTKVDTQFSTTNKFHTKMPTKVPTEAPTDSLKKRNECVINAHLSIPVKDPDKLGSHEDMMEVTMDGLKDDVCSYYSNTLWCDHSGAAIYTNLNDYKHESEETVVLRYSAEPHEFVIKVKHYFGDDETYYNHEQTNDQDWIASIYINTLSFDGSTQEFGPYTRKPPGEDTHDITGYYENGEYEHDYYVTLDCDSSCFCDTKMVWYHYYDDDVGYFVPYYYY